MPLFDQEDDVDYLAELTAPGGKFDRAKYKSEQEMYQAIAKGKVYSDRTIENKNKDFDELREDALKWRADSVAKERFEEYVKNHNTPSKDDDATPNASQVQNFDPNKIEEILEQKIQKMKIQEKEEANLDKVDTLLKNRFGENAKTELRERMNTLNLSQDDLRYLAKKSPEAVMNALGLTPQQDMSYQAPMRGTVRSDSFKPESTVRDALYWEKMRQTVPKEYFSQKNSVQRLKDMDDPDFLTRINQRQRV